MEKYIIILFILTSCGNKNTRIADDMPVNYPEAKVILLNLEGYEANQFNGEKIELIKNSNGLVVETGMIKKIIPEIKNSSRLGQPPENKLTQSKKVQANQNTNLSENVIANKVMRGGIFHNWSTRNKYVLVNEVGDTLKTGTTDVIRSNLIENVVPKIRESRPQRFKDAYSYNYQYLDVDQGMSSSYVFDVLEDENSNMWFATWGGGLSMYNGESFRSFSKNEGLTNNFVRVIEKDSKGNIWMGMEEGGLCVLNINKNSEEKGMAIQQFTLKEGLSGMVVNAIQEDTFGNYWIGFEDKGLCRLSPLQDNNWEITRFTTNEGLSFNTVTSFLVDAKGNLWLTTLGGGINILKKEDLKKNVPRFFLLSEKQGLSSNYVMDICIDNYQKIWVATEANGICEIKIDYGASFGTRNTEFTYITSSHGLSENFTQSIFSDKQNHIWVGTASRGINKISKDRGKLELTQFTKQHGLSNSTVYKINQDSENNIWFGTDGGGVVKYKSGSFKHYTTNEGLPYEVVLSIIEDKYKNIWFGTDGGGIAIYDGTSMTHINEGSGLVSNNIWCMLEDKKNNIWIGTNGGGVCKIVKTDTNNWVDGKTDRTVLYYGIEEGIVSDYILNFLEDENGNIWMATWDAGAIKLAEKNDGTIDYHYYNESSGLSNNRVFYIYEDSQKNIWLGTDGGGLAKISKNKKGEEEIQHFSTLEGLGSNVIITIYEDSDKNLWLGTEGAGVVKFDQVNETFTHYSVKEGLSNDMVWTIEEDNNGVLWLSTENGVSTLTIADDEVRISRFLKNDGLKGVDFFNNSSVIDSENRIWWGSGKSLTMLELDEFTKAENPPEVSLNKLEVNEIVLNYKDVKSDGEVTFSGVSDFFGFPLNLSLPYDQNHLGFFFTGTELSAPHKIKYSYILEGVSSFWSFPKRENKAEFHNLPYGEYVFKVRAIGESEEWSKTYEYAFVIRPPWWHTWWARSIYVIFAVGGVFLFINWRTKNLKRKHKELKKEVTKATEEIVEQHHMLEESYKEITDSIAYAKRIQKAILPTDIAMKESLVNSFVLYKPKDVVAGDFYWLSMFQNDIENELKISNINSSTGKGDRVLFAVADCTGHGVPGAMVSVICNNALNQSVREHGLVVPGDILDKSRSIVLEEFGKSNEEVNDGMDIALCSISFSDMNLEYAGAHNPLWIIRENESMEFKSSLKESYINFKEEKVSMLEVKADKQPIGRFDHSKPFETHRIKLQKNDVIYLFSDGILDQFGGEKYGVSKPGGKKFKAKAFRELLLKIHKYSMEEQKEMIEKAFVEWKGDMEQVDDVCVIGVRL